MNFLAHTFLSCKNEKLLIGNFLGDFVRNKDFDLFEPKILEGIVLHRKIDTFTDNHPIVRQGTHRLHADHGKYAAVIIDVFYDHFLSMNWNQYSSIPLTDFAEGIYDILHRNFSLIPSVHQSRVKSMLTDKWLTMYQDLKGLEFVFNRLRSRLSQPHLLDGVMNSLQQNYGEFNAEFNQFFPDTIAFVDQECSC